MTVTTPAISVIVGVHRVADYLDRCLDSILGQEGAAAEVELIAVDDASPDRSGAILGARRDPRLTVLRTDANVGPGRARERGVKEATGEYLWFVDADDELSDGAIAEVAAALGRLRPDVLILDYENIYADGRVTPSGADLSTPQLTTLADSPVLLNVTSSMWNKVVRRDFLSALGVPFGPGIYEDVVVALACLLTAPRIGVLDRVCYRYRRSRDGSYMAEISDRHFDMFTTYETIYAFVSEQAGQLTAAVQAALFARTMRHYVFALSKVPRSRRRDFFSLMTRDFRRWRPDGFTFPSGPRGVELRLIGRGAHRTYFALQPVNRMRLALTERLR